MAVGDEGVRSQESGVRMHRPPVGGSGPETSGVVFSRCGARFIWPPLALCIGLPLPAGLPAWRAEARSTLEGRWR